MVVVAVVVVVVVVVAIMVMIMMVMMKIMVMMMMVMVVVMVMMVMVMIIMAAMIQLNEWTRRIPASCTPESYKAINSIAILVRRMISPLLRLRSDPIN